MNDKHFEEFTRTSDLVNSNIKLIDKGVKVFMVVWVAAAITSLTILGLIVWAVVHFVTKFW